MAVMADQTGTSDPLRGLSDILANNRAGPGESTLTLAQIISAYSSLTRLPLSAGTGADVDVLQTDCH